MKHRVDLEKVAEGEAFGALAISAKRKHRGPKASAARFTLAQRRALSDLARSLVRVARAAGAEKRRVTLAGVSLELQEDGSEEILSIRTGAAS